MSDPARSRSPRGLHSPLPTRSARPQPRALEPVSSVANQPRWINLAGLEFGTQRAGFCNAFPGAMGTDYSPNGRTTFQRLVEAGFQAFRIPFRWERIQPRLRGPLDPDAVQQLRLQINLARAAGAGVLLDLHNYGRYAMHVDGTATFVGFEEEFDGQPLLGSEDLADFWARMAHAFSGLPGILGYGLMNEPHDLPEGAWVRASARATEAIRAEGDQTTLYVAGDRWSSAAHWAFVNPAGPWVDDPLDKVIYEAHCYLDQDGSGEYHLSYAQERDSDPDLESRSQERLTPFLDWLEAHGAEGFLGEFAVPAQDHRWTALLPPMLRRLDQARVNTAWWAAGEWWGDYPLSLQPTGREEDPWPAQAELFRG